MKLYKDNNGLWVVGDKIVPQGVSLLEVGDAITISIINSNSILFRGQIEELQKENGDPYADLDELLIVCKDFFSNPLNDLVADVEGFQTDFQTLSLTTQDLQEDVNSLQEDADNMQPFKWVYNPLTESLDLIDTSKIRFEIDVATEGNFIMEFEGGRAWLDTTELTGKAVPNVVGKHVVVFEESVYFLSLQNNRLQGDLVIPALTSANNLDFISNQLTSVSFPNLTTVDVLDFYSNQLTSVSFPNLTTVDVLDFDFNQLTSEAVEYILHTLLNAQYDFQAILSISEGTNAAYDTWSQQAKDDLQTLLNRGWMITYNQ